MSGFITTINTLEEMCDMMCDNVIPEEEERAMSDLIYRQNAIEGVKELFACADSGNDECDITYMLENLPSADRPKNMIHIDDVYRLIAGHSNYHGDSILSAFTCLVEGKDVKPIAPLDESADRPTGKWVEVEEYDCVCYQCDQCKSEYVLIDGTPQDNDYNYCPHCGAKMGGEEA